MGCRKCRGWEENECCLSQSDPCDCKCHASCDCAFCHTVELKARSTPSTCHPQNTLNKSTASKIASVLGRESRRSLANDESPDSRPSTVARLSTDDRKTEKARRWSRRGSSLKPLRLFA
ncbi:hypothetical protein COEREDRAFT_81176 [Coemansia reversa NRRL 1564]|uniref:Uncharacterized protein n=1 Tax=Coemansia reversa (strain ATCC 12441 / NRRL 1564) TaxID=763665 RepID=A0A2G5BBY0_COERN|nr:hypothetical protein COEREDRAFT_81176 [Coemansia reversa NRRL 1564]|eukprot:PIA16510.1 hypothetical protein COEREDRAFT_81176 [Coemansia reversa NRRL 1564]